MERNNLCLIGQSQMVYSLLDVSFVIVQFILQTQRQRAVRVWWNNKVDLSFFYGLRVYELNLKFWWLVDLEVSYLSKRRTKLSFIYTVCSMKLICYRHRRQKINIELWLESLIINLHAWSNVWLWYCRWYQFNVLN